MSEVNVDSQLIHRAEEKVVEMTNGCICCTLREDLLEQLMELSKMEGLDAIIIESTGIGEPIHIAETFSYSKNLEKSKNLLKHVSLDTMVTVVDSSTVMSTYFNISPDNDSTSVQCSDKTINHLLLDQVQFANIIILNKVDAIPSPHTIEDVRAVMTNFNPLAVILEAQFGNIDTDLLVNTGLFNFKEAEKNTAWFAEDWGSSVPETEEYGISSFVFKARNPFHPARFDHIIQNRSANNDCFSSVIRAKGFIWLASEQERYMQFHLTGGTTQLSKGGKWWAEVPKDQWPEDESFRQEVIGNWVEPFGDRCQTLVVIGLHMDKEKVKEALEGCLLTDEELSLGPEKWKELPLSASH